MKFGTLQVYPRQGLLVEHGLELPSALIGRGEGSAILIDDFSISRRHARLTIDSGRLLLEDLGSVGGTFVDGERLEPGTRHLVNEGAALRFGEIEARYLPAVVADASPSANAIAEGGGVTESRVGGLAIALVSPGLPVEPGKSTTARLSVANSGRIIDTIKVEIPDLPADWYTVETPSVPILPGGRADITISLHPPRRHDSISGEYTFNVLVRSREYDQHPEAEGHLQVLPYEAVGISLEAIRSKRNFRLLAENNGNDVVRYELAGRDDEQAFKYWFETPAIELQPGQKRTIGLAIRRPRRLMGPATQLPFEIVGKSQSGAEITTRGQLAVNPPLQKFRMPAMFALMALILGATALAVLVLTDGSGTKTASAEDKFAGVHLCEDKEAKEDQAQKNADAAKDKPLANATVVGPYDGGRPLFGEVDSTGAPFFAQNDPRWGGEEYARSLELPNGKDWCGTTIEQCGCAMTSVSVMLALYDIVKMPDGQPLSPKTLNDWFNGNARDTDRGWVSRGYIYGDVIWSAANELSGEIAKLNPGARTVRFVRTGSGSEDEIRAELQAGRPVVVEVPGHWIAAVGLEEDGTILINDPFYRDRKTLDAYKGKVRSSVHYEPSSDLSAVVFTAPADVKFKVTDKQGRVVATGDGTVEQPKDAINQIPGASVSAKTAWRDPTCIESAPPPGSGTNQITLPGARDDYVIEIVGTGNEPANVAVHTYGRDGTSSIATIEGQEGTQAEIGYDPSKDKPEIAISKNGTPVPTSTPVPAGGAPGGDEETPSPTNTPLPLPTATQTPFVEQRTAMTLPAEPGQTRVEVATNSGFELGDPIRFAPGQPNEEDNVIVGFGSFILATPLKFAHSPGEAISRLPRPPGQGPGLPPGITPPPETGPIAPPAELSMACSTLYQASPKQALFVCDAVVSGAYTNTRWSLNGKVINDFTGATSFIMAFNQDQPASVALTVCNQTLCRSTIKSEVIKFPASGGGTSGSGTTGAGTGGPNAAPTPPAGQVAVVCGTEFPIGPEGQMAQFNCEANFSGDYTSISWSAPGGTPANQSGTKKEFTTTIKNEPGAPISLKISATVCNFGTCRTSKPAEVGIGRTITLLESNPIDSVHQGHKLSLMARVQGINKVIPQGGTVQFFADGTDPGNEVGGSATLFTTGSTSVAISVVDTNSLSTSGAGLPHSFVAAYSGGTNAFGSSSEPRIINVLPPIPDGCDSVNNDADPDNDGQPEDFVTDGTCSFATPKNLGAGTMLNTLTLSGGIQDGAANAVIVGPGDPVTISGSAGRTTGTSEYCPGCIRQVYIGIGGYDPLPNLPTATRIGPVCTLSGVFPAEPGGPAFVQSFPAPLEPGVYYLRATTTLDYFCVGPAIGPPENSVGRIIVRRAVAADIELWNDGAVWPAPPNPDPNPDPLSLAGRQEIAGINEGQRILLRAMLPAGSIGRVEFMTTPGNVLKVNGAVPVAQVCPGTGVIDMPPGTADITCIPWEARVLTDPVAGVNQPVTVTALYTDPDPLIVPDPIDTTEPFSTKTYDVRFAANPASNTVNLKVLAPAAVTVTNSTTTTAGQMGLDFTITAEVESVNTALGLTGSGGTVQFKAGNNNIGLPVALDANGSATITWRAGINPPGCTPTPCGGFPFDAHDEGARSTYNDVYAEFLGGTSSLQNACTGASGQTQPNCFETNVDIDAAASTVVIDSVTPSSPTAGETITIVTSVTGNISFAPTGGTVSVAATGGTAGSDAGTLGSGTVAETSPGVYQATITFATGTAGDQLDTPGSYVLVATFAGTSALDPSTSADFNVTLAKEQASVALTLPGVANCPVPDAAKFCMSGGAGVSAHAVVTAPDPNFIDNNTATVRLMNGTTQLFTYNLAQVDAGVHDFSLRGLSAGSYSLTVEYSGNNFYEGPISSTPALELVISKSGATISLDNLTRTTDTAPTGSNSVGDQFSIEAHVNPNGSPAAAGGLVTLTATIGGTTTTLATHTLLANEDGDHTFSFSTATGVLATTAAISLSIDYDGNADLNAGSLAVPVALGPLAKAQPTVTTTASDAIIGQQVTVTYTITAPAGLTVDCPTATPNCVELRAGSSTGTVIASVPVGTAFNALTTGGTSGTCLDGVTSTCAIWVTYTGNDLLANDSDSNNAAITKATPTVTIVASDVVAGASTSVTVSISGLPAGISPDCTDCFVIKANGLTGGQVTILANLDWPSDTSFNLATGAGGTAATCLRATGSCQLEVEYSGNASVNADDDTDTFTISEASSSVVVTFSSGGSVEVDGSIDFIATVTVTGGGQVPTCTGCLQFRRGSTLAGSTATGAAQDVPSNGIVTLARTTGGSTPYGVGSHTIWAVYTGPTYVADSSSSGASMTVTAHPTAIVATATQSGAAGSATTLSADITWSGNQNLIDPGTVQFQVNGVNQGGAQSVSNGVASLSVTLTAGTYQITATYSGGGDFAASSDVTNFQIVVT